MYQLMTGLEEGRLSAARGVQDMCHAQKLQHASQLPEHPYPPHVCLLMQPLKWSHCQKYIYYGAMRTMGWRVSLLQAAWLLGCTFSVIGHRLTADPFVCTASTVYLIELNRENALFLLEADVDTAVCFASLA